jgi:hypothetical protein
VTLLGANLSDADLQGANLSGAAGLTQTQLSKTFGDVYTVLPSHLKPTAHWGVETDEQIQGD